MGTDWGKKARQMPAEAGLALAAVEQPPGDILNSCRFFRWLYLHGG